MSVEAASSPRIGWIGTGRMGVPMLERLLAVGERPLVWNRTRAKAEPLAAQGAAVADSARGLAHCEVVFSMLAGPEEVEGIITGPGGLLSDPTTAPAVIVECSTISADASARVRATAAARGTAFLAAPVSGNPVAVRAGRLVFVVSGPEETFARVLPLLRVIGAHAVRVGEGEEARIVKLCVNTLLGVLTQGLSEVLVLAERSGVPRRVMMDFLNDSALGSAFTRYKVPAFVGLDFTPTFTLGMLRKDMDLSLAQARGVEVPMPLATLTREMIQGLIGSGVTELDFAALLLQQARMSGFDPAPEEAGPPRTL
jgi:3-hydroxyisobutyrate dehydrogenase-like beta-hydroxyacid dehydrogenase